jgi:vacuolar protein sorting-associated protein 13A/C
MDIEPKELENNKEMPWRFDDWRTMREVRFWWILVLVTENYGWLLSAHDMQSTVISPNKVCLQLHGPAWESLKGIPVDREGRTIHLLRPRIAGVLHRMLCEVKLKDNVKIVTFRSTTVLVNDTGGTVDMMVVNGKGQMTSGLYRIGMPRAL